MDLIETLRTTGAVREFRSDPVDDDVVARILDNARFAPSGGNRQGWHAVVVKDPATRTALRDLYLPGWREYLAMRQAGPAVCALTVMTCWLLPIVQISPACPTRSFCVPPHMTGEPS